MMSSVVCIQLESLCVLYFFLVQLLLILLIKVLNLNNTDLQTTAPLLHFPNIIQGKLL